MNRSAECTAHTQNIPKQQYIYNKLIESIIQSSLKCCHMGQERLLFKNPQNQEWQLHRQPFQKMHSKQEYLVVCNSGSQVTSSEVVLFQLDFWQQTVISIMFASIQCSCEWFLTFCWQSVVCEERFLAIENLQRKQVGMIAKVNTRDWSTPAHCGWLGPLQALTHFKRTRWVKGNITFE